MDPRHIYRSILPFLPPSSPILVHYNKLSDIKVLRVRSQNNKRHVPPEAPTPPNNVPRHGDPPIFAIACTALSDDGRRVALGFHDGVVEVVETELGTTISRFADGLAEPPVWLLFIDGGHKLATETSEGDVYILDNFSLRQRRIASRIDGSTVVFASLSHDGSMIVRAAEHSTKEWYENMCIIHITTHIPTIHSLSTPSHIIPDLGPGERFPLQRSVGFSPDGTYVAAFDTQQAFVWSCTSFQVIAHYSIEDPDDWFLNTNHPSTIPILAFLNDVVITPFPEHSGSINSTSCVLFTLRTRLADLHSVRMRALSLAIAIAAAADPVQDSIGRVWFRGCEIMTIPDSWNSPWWSADPEPFFEPSFWEFPQNVSFLTSKDGTRFLLHDNEGFPALVDISRLISGDRAV